MTAAPFPLRMLLGSFTALALTLAACSSPDGVAPGPSGSTGGAGGERAIDDAAAGSAGTGGASDAGTVDAARSPARACEQPMPYPPANTTQTSPEDTGFEFCQSNAIHRSAVVACPWLGSSASTCPVVGPSCQSDADCLGGSRGICAQAHQLGDCGCLSGVCLQDGDCGSGSICLCTGSGGTCVPATCTSDASCPSGSSCLSAARSCHGEIIFACQGASDECQGDLDCPPDPQDPERERCVFKDGKRSCVPGCI